MTTAIKNILVPINYSKTALNAVNSAIRMCLRHDAVLHLLHVGNTMDLYPGAGMQAPVIPLAKKFIEDKNTRLNQFADAIEKTHGIQCMRYFEYDGLVMTICEKAKALSIDIIVMGINPRGISSAYFTDSLAYKVLARVDCPVLTIPKNKRINAFKNVLIPVRHGIGAIEKMNVGESIINKNDARVHLVGALSSADALGFNRVRNSVSALRAKLSTKNIKSSYELYLGKNIVSDIVEAGKEAAADLIVITASTKRNLAEFINGNFTQKLINNPGAAVLCVKERIMGNQPHRVQYLFSSQNSGL